ncbi:lipase-like protein [Leptomonas pyrrhocoris]|uniref:Lipase-like protein n=1 Tax=Leptomonas pyrrhocoris TaxID=157538 RepID=A0A0N0VDB8_LEPPY|nr:lipase-like protein [Leptomonas pyrrhocoris]KPA75221.1 lipase-like protein [Leptomonas pyrrhocoris]|eukprot:XP_015653660.1 lipase-like protein [Leptomonas pyrrhocoris]
MLRISFPCRSRRAWRLTPTWAWPVHRRDPLTRSASSSASSSAPSVPHSDPTTAWHGSSCGQPTTLSNTSSAPAQRLFTVSWLLWPQWVSHRVAALRRAAARRVPLPHSVAHAAVQCHHAAERFLSVVERPARVGTAGAVIALRIAVQLAVSVLQLGHEVYLYVFGPRLRRLLRFAVGVPFLFGTLFLLQMREWYFPEVGAGLDSSCVASLPLFHSVDEALANAALLQQRYHKLLAARREAKRQASADTSSQVVTTPPQSLAPSLIQPLTRAEENELLGAVFVLIRSIETQIVGTAEERELITPRAGVVTTASPAAPFSPHPRAASSAPPATTATITTTVIPEDTVTATPHLSESSAVAAAAPTAPTTPPIMISPAEYILRVIMAIAIAEGWADITEHTRVLFQELVRNKTPPVQSRIVQAVGELCSLSYELESGRVDAITLNQRKRIAAAIDAFRPEKSVEERCTIAHETSILPLPDFDHTTRCLGVIRKSPGRKPQLILCFVGTNSNRNWLTNFNYWPVPLPARYGVVGAALPPDSSDARVVHPMVHRGFLGLVQTVPYREVAADFDHILLVGHSLGGALAQLAGLELAAERPSRRITVITVASPRVLAVDWCSRLRMIHRHWWQHRPHHVEGQHENSSQPTLLPVAPAGLRHGDAVERDALAEMLTTPANYRHFRGYLQSDVVPHLPPEFLHFTHNGQHIPLNTGCTTSLSFMAWGMYSKLYHSADLYRSVLKQPIVSQTHWYMGEEENDELVEDEADMRMHA